MLERYQEFVDGVTSEASKDDEVFLKRLAELSKEISISRMDTACSGIAGESGEIADLWKKIKFHGKPWNEENKDKMISEAGDMFWYLMLLCMALQIDPEDVITKNIDKLVSRYPGGKFSIERAENRID